MNKFIKATREKQQQAGLNQAQLAEALGVTQGAVSRFLKRGIRPNSVLVALLRLWPELVKELEEDKTDA